MYEELLPVHPYTGLTAVGILPSGRPVWPVLGAADDDAGEGQGDDTDTGEDDQDETDTDGDGQDEQEDKPLGPKGQKALQAEKEKRRNEAAKRRTAETRATELEAELAKLRNGGKGESGKGSTDPDPDQVRREAEKTAADKANARILRAEVKAAAAGKLADPGDAARFLDLSRFEVDENGDVDTDEIAEAITELIESKPYLAAQGGKRFQGTGDGGAKPKPPKARPKSLREAYARKHG